MDEKKKQGTLKGDTKNENGGHKNDELKNLIAGYVAEAIKNEKATWEKDFSDRIVSEREDAAKMATMSAEDRAKAEMEKDKRILKMKDSSMYPKEPNLRRQRNWRLKICL